MVLLFSSDTRRASHVVVFFCKHVYHEDCLPARDVVSIHYPALVLMLNFVLFQGIKLKVQPLCKIKRLIYKDIVSL